MIRQGKINVNGKKVTIPSYIVKVNDVITLADGRGTNKELDLIPSWLLWDSKKKEIKVINRPSKEDIGIEINEQLIVEFYSR